MMGDCGRYYADEEAVRDASIEDLDADTIKLYMMERFSPVFRGKNIDELTMKDYSLDRMAGFVIKERLSSGFCGIFVSFVLTVK